MKIVYCVNSIQHRGGIAVSTITKSNTFAENGHEVFIIVTDFIANEPINLHNNVKLIHLDVNYYADDWKSKFHLLKGIIIKRRKHKQFLTKILKEINPNIVISVGQSEKYFLPEIKGKWKTIREFHYDKFYRIRKANSFLKKIVARLINFYDYNYKIRKYDHIVVLTERDFYNWRKNDKVVIIPNMVQCKIGEYIQDSKTIVTVGRIEKEKNQASLIRVVAPILKQYSDWKLEIYGKGSEIGNLKNLINLLDLNKNIFLKGEIKDPSKAFSNSSIFVLTSLYEGFGLVIIEAMAYGVPVVSYNSPCGPAEIIQHNKNGIIIELNNEVELGNSIKYLIQNKEERIRLGQEGKKRYFDFVPENIYPKWIKLFNT